MRRGSWRFWIFLEGVVWDGWMAKEATPRGMRCQLLVDKPKWKKAFQMLGVGT